MNFRLHPENVQVVFSPGLYFFMWLFFGLLFGFLVFVALPLLVPSLGKAGPTMGIGLGFVAGYWWVRFIKGRHIEKNTLAKAMYEVRAEINNDSTPFERLKRLFQIYGHRDDFSFAIKSHPNWREKE